MPEIRKRCLLLIDQGELDRLVPHEFDNARGIVQLLGGDLEPWPQPGPWEEARFKGVQRARMRELMARVKRGGLMPRIRASFLLKSVYPNLGVRGGVDWIHDYLAHEIRARELVRRLQTLPGISDARLIVRLIDEQVKVVELAGRHAEQRMLAGFFGELVEYRYHLKLAAWLYAGLDSLRLLSDAEKITK